jgi:hypothetical protein
MAVHPFASACDLVLFEHRSGKEVLRWPTSQNPIKFNVSFTHSVLGTPVVDKYEFRSIHGSLKAVLVEEFFEGQGYGLPYGATSPGEKFERTAQGWRLSMNRLVDPLIQLPLPSQNIRLSMGQQSILLGSLSPYSMLITTQRCNESFFSQ